MNVAECSVSKNFRGYNQQNPNNVSFGNKHKAAFLIDACSDLADAGIKWEKFLPKKETPKTYRFSKFLAENKPRTKKLDFQV